ncbi:electron transport complex subunit RsxG [Marichromatium gracile]|uniref:electron transport complex subunit RsxG n=1 Tax=Marichromatium gracile TaxID=1048 RepID=UPI001F26F2E3|nr:electron transport complex subunit RsxG [Marichromatium gracile]MCF1182472.1 electron transport complex subunit RsxG [Marichromatium gracile]
MNTLAEPSYRARVGYQAGLLGGFALLAAALLVMGDIATRDTIALREAEDLKATLTQVIPAELHDNDLLDATVPLVDAAGHTVTVYRALRDGAVSALAFPVVGKGYAGDIRLMLGVDPVGRILGVRVIAHSETPGLGDKIELAKDDWILDFDGRALGDPPAARWAVAKDGGDFDQFSGATITPRAVVRAVRAGLERFAAERSRLIVAPDRLDTAEE